MAFTDFCLFQSCFSQVTSFISFGFYLNSFAYRFAHFSCLFNCCLKTSIAWFESNDFILFLQIFMRFSSINLGSLNLHYCLDLDFLSHNHLKSNLHHNHRLPSVDNHCPYHRRPLAIDNFYFLFSIYFCRFTRCFAITAAFYSFYLYL